MTTKHGRAAGTTTHLAGASRSVRPPRRTPSAARARILATADRLFYTEGIRAVGVQRVVDESLVTRVTLYRHFRSKDDLVLAYLEERARQCEEQISTIVAATPDDPQTALRSLGRLVASNTLASECRGCPFINAAAEYADPAHPACTVVSEHRAWVQGITERLLREIGHPHPHATAELLLMLRTGAVVGASLDRSDTISQVFLNAWNSIVERRDG